MKKMYTLISALVITLSPATQASDVTAVDAVNALEARFGVNKGMRRNHTKGLCFNATFKANEIASTFTRSKIFDGSQVDVIGRFSHAGGKLNIADAKGTVFGMGLEMRNGNTVHKMAMLNLPFFAVASPEDFVARLRLSTPDPDNAAQQKADMAAFNAAHPSVGKLANVLSSRTHHYADFTDHFYNSIHTFYLINEQGVKTPARWMFYPSGDNVQDFATEQQPAQNFASSIGKRLADSTLSFDMIVSFPFASDPLTDPTFQWVGNGQKVNFGTLTINDLEAQCEKINYDPNVVSEGVEPSADPVLQFRSGAYAVSFAKRLTEKQ